MTEKNYADCAVFFSFQLLSGGGFSTMTVKKTENGYEVSHEAIGAYMKDNKPSPKKISSDEGRRFFEKLFSECRVMEYPEDFGGNDCILDGARWTMHIEFESGETKDSGGYMVYPRNRRKLMTCLSTLDSAYEKYM